MDSNVQVAGPPSQSSVPFTAQSQTLTLIGSRGHFHLQLCSLPGESVAAAVLARLIDHRPCSIALGTCGYLDHLCKTRSSDLLNLSSSIACLAGLPLASRLSAGPAADTALGKSRDFYLSVSSVGCVVETDLEIVS